MRTVIAAAIVLAGFATGPAAASQAAGARPLRPESSARTWRPRRSSPPSLPESPAEGAVAVERLRVVMLACRNPAGEARIATREMVRAGTETLLLVDPATLSTALAPRPGWDCAETTETAQQATRFMEAVRSASAAPDRPEAGRPLMNEGLLAGKGEGSFVTGDLCPSPFPLDRAFLERIAAAEPRAPVALSITGLWLRAHPQDFRWLREASRRGALAITWVNHSFHHPYDPGRPPGQNFLLMPGLDIAREIIETERLLIAGGETPSVFFRFPGLVASPALLAAVRQHHLVTLGASTWAAFGLRLKPGGIVLLHPNGNEPLGLRLFARALDSNTLPRPFRPITEAP